jgi:EpsI family protein
MKRSVLVSVILGGFMTLAAALAWLMTPIVESAAQQAKINLETMIPANFDGWKIEPDMAARIVNPDDKGLLVEIYDQTLSRTYINTEGERVMLSIAYGGKQSTDLHVHRPEICYAAGGFSISKISKTFVDTTIGRIPVMRLVAKQGARNEPITYWVRVGDSLTRGWIEQKLAAIGYGLTRKVPDGLLFRVSTISNDEQDSYRIQQAFLVAMMKAVKSTDRFWLVGRLTP